MILAHAIRRAVRALEDELAPKLADQEDDGDPELVGERIDPAVFYQPGQAAFVRKALGKAFPELAESES